MTLLNTVSNLGTMLASQASLRSIDTIGLLIPSHNVVDGFILVTVLAGVLGLLWLYIFKPVVARLEAAPASEWASVRA